VNKAVITEGEGVMLVLLINGEEVAESGSMQRLGNVATDQYGVAKEDIVIDLKGRDKDK
jgi:hypothetical protein